MGRSLTLREVPQVPDQPPAAPPGPAPGRGRRAGAERRWARRRPRGETPRRNSVTVWFSDEEYALVATRAASARLAVSAFLAEIGTAPAIAERDPQQTDDGARADQLVDLMGIRRQLVGAARNLNQAVTAGHATGEFQSDLGVAAAYVIRIARRVEQAVQQLARPR